MIRYIRDDYRHLVCIPYNISNLHKMAEDLGIKRHFFHKGRLAHYDIPARMRKKIEADSKIFRVSSGEIVRIISEGIGRAENKDGSCSLTLSQNSSESRGRASELVPEGAG